MKMASVKPLASSKSPSVALDSWCDDITSLETFGVVSKPATPKTGGAKRKRLKLSEFVLYDTKLEGAVSILNNSALRSKTKLTYEKSLSDSVSARYLCKLYVQDTFICEGSGTTQKVAKKDASQKGVSILKTTNSVIDLDLMRKLDEQKRKNANRKRPDDVLLDSSPKKVFNARPQLPPNRDNAKPRLWSVISISDKTKQNITGNNAIPLRVNVSKNRSRNDRSREAMIAATVTKTVEAIPNGGKGTFPCGPISPDGDGCTNETIKLPPAPSSYPLRQPIPSIFDVSYRRPVFYPIADYNALYGIGEKSPSPIPIWRPFTPSTPQTHDPAKLITPPSSHELSCRGFLETRSSAAGPPTTLRGPVAEPRESSAVVEPPRGCFTGKPLPSSSAEPLPGSTVPTTTNPAAEPRWSYDVGRSPRMEICEDPPLPPLGIEEAVFDAEKEADKLEMKIEFKTKVEKIFGDDDDVGGEYNNTLLYECSLLVDGEGLAVARSSLNENVSRLKALMKAVNLMRARQDMERFKTMLCSHSYRLYKMTGEYGLHVQYSVTVNDEGGHEDGEISQPLFICDLYIADHLLASAAETSEVEALEMACKISFEKLIKDPGQLGDFQNFVITRDCSEIAK